MLRRPRVAIVGAGNLGSALAVSLRQAGYAIDAVIARDRSTSLNRARKLARKVGARALAGSLDGVRADVIWFCVPDSEILRAAGDLASQPRSAKKTTSTGRARNWKGLVALHSSGALASDVLEVLRTRGAAVASVHPMMTFVRGLRPSLAGVAFAIQGDAPAVRVARRIVRDLGGTTYAIRKEDKAAYHAWGTLASPLFTALLAIMEHLAIVAGVGRGASRGSNHKEAKRRMLPILRQTLENYAAFDAGDAFSGPIIRGDVGTVKQHLRVLRRVPPARAVYVALAQAALRYLPAKNKNALRKLLRRNERTRQ